MTSELLQSILYICKEIDVIASKLYTKISHKIVDEEEKEFWQNMAAEEREHVLFWKNAIVYSVENTIPEIFVDENVVYEDLKKSKELAIKLLESIEQREDTKSYFTTAYWMEFYLLYPSLDLIFHYMAILSNCHNPETDYEKHLLRFVDGFKRFGNVSQEMELLGSLLNSIWKRNRELVTMSMYDTLTKVFNRKGINDLMISYSSLAKRNRYNTGLLMIDIDNFKKVNDTYGHQLGDEVLKEVSDRLSKSLRKSDLLGRFGGEEFIVFLTNIEYDEIKKIAEKLISIISESPIQKIEVTISIGCCMTETQTLGEDEMISKMISCADAKLYSAKKNGKNRYEI